MTEPRSLFLLRASLSACMTAFCKPTASTSSSISYVQYQKTTQISNQNSRLLQVWHAFPHLFKSRCDVLSPEIEMDTIDLLNLGTGIASLNVTVREAGPLEPPRPVRLANQAKNSTGVILGFMPNLSKGALDFPFLSI